MGTWPRTPSTMRMMSTVWSRIGMKSMTRTEPSGVSNSVSSTSVSSRYRRRAARPPAAGAICQRPWFSSPRSAAKHAPLSNRGAHNQSIEPSSPTSAAVCVSPIMAYCSIREAIAVDIDAGSASASASGAALTSTWHQSGARAYRNGCQRGADLGGLPRGVFDHWLPPVAPDDEDRGGGGKGDADRDRADERERVGERRGRLGRQSVAARDAARDRVG